MFGLMRPECFYSLRFLSISILECAGIVVFLREGRILFWVVCHLNYLKFDAPKFGHLNRMTKCSNSTSRSDALNLGRRFNAGGSTSVP